MPPPMMGRAIRRTDLMAPKPITVPTIAVRPKDTMIAPKMAGK